MTKKLTADSRRFLVAGNWKMNGSIASLRSFYSAFREPRLQNANLVLCLPAPLIPTAVELFAGTPLSVGAQNCFTERSGAFTGEISAELLMECGARYVITGHSERRSLFGETDATINKKAQAIISAGLTTILCVGETSSERAADQHIEVVLAQLEAAICEATSYQNTIIAYEPVWAIGSGQSASIQQITEMHNAIDRWLVEKGKPLQILYGGSVKPDTAAEIAAINTVNGFLVGGASLDPEAFRKVALSAPR